MPTGRMRQEGTDSGAAAGLAGRTMGEHSAENRREKGKASVDTVTFLPASSSTSSAGGQPKAPDSVAIASESLAVKKERSGSSERPPRA